MARKILLPCNQFAVKLDRKSQESWRIDHCSGFLLAVPLSIAPVQSLKDLFHQPTLRYDVVEVVQLRRHALRLSGVALGSGQKLVVNGERHANFDCWAVRHRGSS